MRGNYKEVLLKCNLIYKLKLLILKGTMTNTGLLKRTTKDRLKHILMI